MGGNVCVGGWDTRQEALRGPAWVGVGTRTEGGHVIGDGGSAQEGYEEIGKELEADNTDEDDAFGDQRKE